jgi:hypothetical protein
MPPFSDLNYRETTLWAAYILISGLVIAALTVATAILYQYFTFNSCPPGTRLLPSPKGRIPVVGHRYLITPVSASLKKKADLSPIFETNS